MPYYSLDNNTEMVKVKFAITDQISLLALAARLSVYTIFMHVTEKAF